MNTQKISLGSPQINEPSASNNLPVKTTVEGVEQREYNSRWNGTEDKGNLRDREVEKGVLKDITNENAEKVKESTDLLQILKKRLEVLENEARTIELMGQTSPDREDILFIEDALLFLEENPELLENEAVKAVHLEKIFLFAKPDQLTMILQHLNYDSELLNEEITLELLEKILTASCPISVLGSLQKYPHLLKNNTIVSCFDEIVVLPEAYEMLNTLGRSRSLLSNETIMTRLKSTISLANFHKLLDILERESSWLNNQTITMLLETILTLGSKYNAELPKALEENIDLLVNERITPEILKKIFASPQFFKVIKTLRDYEPLLLKNAQKMTQELLDEILDAPYAGDILIALVRYRRESGCDLLENEFFSVKAINKVCSLGNIPQILKSVVEKPGLFQLLANENFTSELLKEIFSIRADRCQLVLQALVESPDLLHKNADWHRILHYATPDKVLSSLKDYIKDYSL